MVIEQDGIFAKELGDQGRGKRLIFMHQVIMEREGDIKIAREEIFSSNIDTEHAFGRIASSALRFVFTLKVLRSRS